MGSDKFTAEQLASKADQLRAEVQELDELARAKETEWNEILSMRKLKEEAYLRIERRRQVVGFMESSNGDGAIPPAVLALAQQSQRHFESRPLMRPSKALAGYHAQASAKQNQQHQHQHHQQLLENGPRQSADAHSPDNRQIGEGRQGPIVDVRSIIADYRLRHPEVTPRR